MTLNMRRNVGMCMWKNAKMWAMGITKRRNVIMCPPKNVNPYLKRYSKHDADKFNANLLPLDISDSKKSASKEVS